MKNVNSAVCTDVYFLTQNKINSQTTWNTAKLFTEILNSDKQKATSRLLKIYKI